jgi:hypothetical protein
MPLELVPGNASKDPLYQSLIHFKEQHFVEFEDRFFEFRRSVNSIEIMDQTEAGRLDDLLAEVTGLVRQTHDVFVDLINVRDTPLHLLDRLMESMHDLSRSFIPLFAFIHKYGENIDTSLYVTSKEMITLLNRIHRNRTKSRSKSRNRRVSKSRSRSRSRSRNRYENLPKSKTRRRYSRGVIDLRND